MVLADVNVILNAFRADLSHHRICRDWLDSVVNGWKLYGISPQVLSSVIRIATNRRIFANPNSIDEILRFCTRVLDQSHCVVVQPGERHWPIFARLCHETDATGNLVPDAWFAALAIEWGCEWITLDRDFAGFSGLNWRTPS